MPRELALFELINTSHCIIKGDVIYSHEFLSILDPQHFLFNAPLNHESDDLNFVLLTHPVYTIDRLRFNCKAPPRIHHENSLRARQVEAYASGSQAQKKQDTDDEHGLVTEVCWPVLSTRGEEES